ncbi:DUF2274 domain-containing protein [Lichenicoccus sp.]|uniref:DUF2274 domain-containing protein n=1 Tax=Lichenicoccus sp. TaxID=2781899 RepID=UPI003D0FA11E
MNSKLRLGPLPKMESVRLTITLPAAVKSDLDRYAELYAREYGEPVDAVALVPHMLAAFMERDRAFRAARQSSTRSSSGTGSASISAATSSTSETAGDGSSR